MGMRPGGRLLLGVIVSVSLFSSLFVSAILYARFRSTELYAYLRVPGRGWAVRAHAFDPELGFAPIPRDTLRPHLPDREGHPHEVLREGLSNPGRHDLFSTSFETIERNIREQLGSMLSAGGFDPARDIEAITVNRWAHGYAMGGNTLFDDYLSDDPRAPHFRARKPFGRIAIANSDAASQGMLEAAVEEAHRAITELN